MWTWRLKFHSSHKIPKRCFFPYVHFSHDLRQNVSILIAITYRWDPYGNFGVRKRWGNKTCQSPSNKQSWASWFVKKMDLMTSYQKYDSTLQQSVLCQLSLLFSPGSPKTVKYFITNCSTNCMSVLLSATRFGISQWHYNFRSYKMCYSTSSHI